MIGKNEYRENYEVPKINPKITQDFVAFIEKKAKIGKYRVDVKIGDKIIPIDVFPTVFPPQSEYSISSKSLYESFGNLKNMEVADIGSGTAIDSIVTIMAGAKHVDASDINPEAVKCSKYNIKLNGLENKINVFQSDLFSSFPPKKYDLIIANLPIVNFPAEKNPINQALYDKGFEIHKRLFADAKNFLAKNGIITFTHANLQSAQTKNPDYDFEILEKMIEEYGYEIVKKSEREEMGYKWINYKIKLRKNL